MKYLVVSDNHGDREILVDIVKQRAGEMDVLFHCGDSELEADDQLWETFDVVKGNCDFVRGYERVKVIDTGCDRVFLTHGHLYDVNMGLERLAYATQEAEATIVLFGHTHCLGAEYVSHQLFLNPGSISQPRGKYRDLPTYAIINSDDTRYEVTYYNRSHDKQDDLTVIINK